MINKKCSISKAHNLTDYVIIPSCWWGKCTAAFLEGKVVLYGYYAGEESYGFTDIKIIEV